MARHVIEFNQRCRSCEGSGLFVGRAEHDGFAVQCSTCKGKGHHATRIEYDDPERLVKREDVKRVVERNPGIILRGDDPEQFGGISYEDWFAGKGFAAGTEMRGFTCPAWYFMKGSMWKECESVGGGPYLSCLRFDTKTLCWDKWDEEIINAKR